MELSAPERIPLARADRISRQINEFIAQMDRSSGRDRERVRLALDLPRPGTPHRGALPEVELTARRTAAAKERLERDLEVIQSTRKAVLYGLRAAALEEEVEAAQSYLWGHLHQGAIHGPGERSRTGQSRPAQGPGPAIVPDRILGRAE